MKMKIKNIDTKVYVSIRYVAFIGASIVSAIFNLMLFQGMSPKNDTFLLAILSSMSIVLELTKVSTVITANLFREIYEKTKEQMIKVKQYVFFTLYCLLTLLSIIASLGFTFTLNDRMNSISSTQLDQIDGLQKKLSIIQQDELDIEAMKKEVTSMTKDIAFSNVNQKSLSIASTQQANTDIRNAETRLASAKSHFKKFQDVASYQTNVNKLKADLEADPDSKSKKEKLETAENFFNSELSSLGVSERDFSLQYTKAKNERDGALSDYNNISRANNRGKDISSIDLSFVDDVGVNIEMLQTQLVEKKKQFIAEINQYIKDTEDEPKELKSIIEAQTFLVGKAKEIKENAGVNVMFREFGRLFNADPAIVTLVILIFVSILIELTIYQTSPDLKPTRKILYFFRNHLNKVDVKKMFDAFEKENKLWLQEEKPMEKPKKVVETPVEVLVEKEDNSIVEAPVVAKTTPTETKKPKRKTSTKKKNEQVKEEPKVESKVEEQPIEETPKAKKPRARKPKVVQEIVQDPVSVKTPVEETTTETKEELKVEEKAPTAQKEETPVEETIVKETVSETKEELNKEELKVEEKAPTVQKEEAKIVTYRFGKTYDTVKAQLVDYLKLLFEEVLYNEYDGFARLNNPDEAIKTLKLKKSTAVTFNNRLVSMKLRGVPLAELRDGVLYSKFNVNQLIAYMTQIID